MKVWAAIACALGLTLAAEAQFSITESFKAESFKTDLGETLPVRAWRKYTQQDLPVPAVVVLHGSGECGTDNRSQLNTLQALHREVLINPDLPPALWAAPQCSQLSPWVRTIAFKEDYRMPRYPAPALRLVKAWLDDQIAKGIVDPERIILVGSSLGGFGTWDAIQRWPNTFAAAVPICGGGSTEPEAVKNAATTSIWVFHGSADGSVPVACSQRMVAALARVDHAPLYTEFAGAGHDIWGRVFADSAVWKWAFRQRRGKPTAAADEEPGVVGGFFRQLKAYVTPE